MRACISLAILCAGCQQILGIDAGTERADQSGGGAGASGGESSGGGQGGTSGHGGGGQGGAAGTGGDGSQGGGGGQLELGCTNAAHRYAFTVPTTVSGDVGVPSMDAICQTAADAAGCTRSFRAWVSTYHTEDARDRIADGPWYRTDGELIATSTDDLCDGIIDHAIETSADGAVLIGQGYAWTGTLLNGMQGTLDCDNWSSPSASAIVGNIHGTAFDWTNAYELLCTAATVHLYCFEAAP